MMGDECWSLTAGLNKVGGHLVEESREGWICWYGDIMIPEDGKKVIRCSC